MRLSSQDAFLLARKFHEAAADIGKRRFDDWDTLTPGQKRELEDAQWSLLNASSDMVTKAVGLVLDETQIAFAKLTGIVTEAKEVLATIEDIRKAIDVAAALVGLAAAVISRDVGAIVGNVQSITEALS
ncbi:hypothetical protein [Inquilinus sp. CA228]|uniref:hypothetical protein n=1 Tax=Inquilinus sp. CA228 TaxID=3455609 RepID=UPI003F8D1B04